MSSENCAMNLIVSIHCYGINVAGGRANSVYTRDAFSLRDIPYNLYRWQLSVHVCNTLPALSFYGCTAYALT